MIKTQIICGLCILLHIALYRCMHYVSRIGDIRYTVQMGTLVFVCYILTAFIIVLIK